MRTGFSRLKAGFLIGTAISSCLLFADNASARNYHPASGLPSVELNFGAIDKLRGTEEFSIYKKQPQEAVEEEAAQPLEKVTVKPVEIAAPKKDKAEQKKEEKKVELKEPPLPPVLPKKIEKKEEKAIPVKLPEPEAKKEISVKPKMKPEVKKPIREVAVAPVIREKKEPEPKKAEPVKKPEVVIAAPVIEEKVAEPVIEVKKEEANKEEIKAEPVIVAEEKQPVKEEPSAPIKEQEVTDLEPVSQDETAARIEQEQQEKTGFFSKVKGKVSSWFGSSEESEPEEEERAVESKDVPVIAEKPVTTPVVKEEKPVEPAKQEEKVVTEEKPVEVKQEKNPEEVKPTPKKIVKKQPESDIYIPVKPAPKVAESILKRDEKDELDLTAEEKAQLTDKIKYSGKNNEPKIILAENLKKAEPKPAPVKEEKKIEEVKPEPVAVIEEKVTVIEEKQQEAEQPVEADPVQEPAIVDAPKVVAPVVAPPAPIEVAQPVVPVAPAAAPVELFHPEGNAIQPAPVVEIAKAVEPLKPQIEEKKEVVAQPEIIIENKVEAPTIQVQEEVKEEIIAEAVKKEEEVTQPAAEIPAAEVKEEPEDGNKNIVEALSPSIPEPAQVAALGENTPAVEAVAPVETAESANKKKWLDVLERAKQRALDEEKKLAEAEAAKNSAKEEKSLVSSVVDWMPSFGKEKKEEEIALKAKTTELAPAEVVPSAPVVKQAPVIEAEPAKVVEPVKEEKQSDKKEEAGIPAALPSKGAAQIAVASGELPPVKSLLTISFKGDEIDLSDANSNKIAAIAKEIGASDVKVKITSYAPKKGESTNVARRLSLKRAIAVRAKLIESGISAMNINVQAMGEPEEEMIANSLIITRAE